MDSRIRIVEILFTDFLRNSDQFNREEGTRKVRDNLMVDGKEETSQKRQ